MTDVHDPTYVLQHPHRSAAASRQLDTRWRTVSDIEAVTRVVTVTDQQGSHEVRMSLPRIKFLEREQ